MNTLIARALAWLSLRSVVVVAALIAFGSLTAVAAANTYGGYGTGNSNRGTRSSITVNGTWSTSAAACIAYYSDAGASTEWIQTGVYRCFNGATADRTCGGGATTYTEVKSPGVAPACTAGSGVSSGTAHTYTVDNTGSQWRGYVDGSLLGGALAVSGSLSPLEEPGEYTGSCSDSFTASASFGSSSPVWQIWNGSSWNSASGYSSLVSGCGWSNSGTPSPWTTSH